MIFNNLRLSDLLPKIELFFFLVDCRSRIAKEF